MSRSRRVAIALAVAVTGAGAGAGALADAPDADANMAKWWSEGESHGPLVPQDDTNLRVDSEELSFVVAPALASAEVTATYHLTNGGASETHSDVAFVMASAEHGTPTVNASVTIDGAPVEGQIITEADRLAPLLDQWLSSRPEAEAELKRLAALDRSPAHRESEKLRQLAPACRGDCSDLVRWYQTRQKPDRDLVRRAAFEAIPDEVPKLQRGWTTQPYGSALSWLTFPLTVAAGATRTVVVRYTHIAGSDARRAINTVYTFDYLLSPAKRWASFGKLHLDIQVPPDADLRGSEPHADFSTLPPGELHFELMSKRGLLFGMSQPRGYWLILLAVMAVVTIPAARRLGRVRSHKTRARRVLGSLFGTGSAAIVWNGVIAWALSAVFPQRAFGFSYDAALGLFAAIFVFAMAAIVVSLVTSSSQSPGSTPGGSASGRTT